MIKAIFKFLFKLFFPLALIGLFLGVVAFGVLWVTSPSVEQAGSVERRPVISLVDDQGRVFSQLGDLYGEPLDVADLPPHLIDAVTSTEDRRFFSHFGIDPRGLARAMLRNLQEGRFFQGGSTITQQTAKNLFLTSDRTLRRKIHEAVTALKLERRYSKEQILKIYLNRVYFGAGTYGVDAAARRYFNKSASEVDLFEAAVIAGLLKAPSRYNPERSFQTAKDRATVVLRAMAAAGKIDEALIAPTLSNATEARYSARAARSVNASYVDWVLRELNATIGTPDQDILVHTTFDAELQASAQREVTRAIAEQGPRVNADQAAFLAMDGNGAVKAIVGGVSPKRGAFNRATQAERQPGSVFKLFVYLAALEQGFQPDSLVRDASITVDGWTPRNAGGREWGDVPLREAFRRSLNLSAVHVSEYVGRQKVIDTARRLGITSELRNHPSLPLGASEVHLIDLVAAYTAIANGGRTVVPFGITKITHAADQSRVLFQVNPPQMRATDSLTAQYMRDMLAETVSSGTARRAAVQGVLGGKTGTTTGPRDAWFLGFSTDVVAGVWVGNDDNREMTGISGGGLPTDIWLNAVKPTVSAERKRQDILVNGLY